MNIEGRINRLREKPDLVYRQLEGVPSANCHGTVIWIFDLEKHLLKVWSDAILIKESYKANGNGAFVVFPKAYRPGFVGEEPMRAFLDYSPRVKRTQGQIPGVVFTIWYEIKNRGFEIRHSGILLPNGNLFEKEGIDYTLREDRSISKVISDVPKEAKNIEVRFYKFI
jgi:hypothetical protein